MPDGAKHSQCFLGLPTWVWEGTTGQDLTLGEVIKQLWGFLPMGPHYRSITVCGLGQAPPFHLTMVYCTLVFLDTATWCVFRGGVLNLANLVRVGLLKKETHLS